MSKTGEQNLRCPYKPNHLPLTKDITCDEKLCAWYRNDHKKCGILVISIELTTLLNYACRKPQAEEGK